jgi:inorganic triphosphatase YgiF
MLALPAGASARPGSRSFTATFPIASSLCTRVANGHTPPRLAGSTAQVAAACATLRSSFTTAQNTYTTTVAPLLQQANAAIATLRATCKAARAAHNPAACQTARTQTRALLRSLRAQVHAAAVAYHAAVDAARKTFWTTVRALRGGSTLTPDVTVGPSPLTLLPSNAALLRA